ISCFLRRPNFGACMTDSLSSAEGIFPPISLRGRRQNTLPASPAPFAKSLRLHSLEFIEPLQGILLPQQGVIDRAGIERAAGLIRELVEVAEELLHLSLDGNEQPDVPRQEFDRAAALLEPLLVGIHPQVCDERPGRGFANSRSDIALGRREA